MIGATTIINKLYGGEVEVFFERLHHIYKVNGEFVPSVTTINRILDKPALIPWAANVTADYWKECIQVGKAYDEVELQEFYEKSKDKHKEAKKTAANFGTLAHKWIEKYIAGERPPLPQNEVLRMSISKFLLWVKKHNVKFLTSEQLVYSRQFNYVGTLDFTCIYEGRLYIGDIKTSKGISNEYLMQTAAYRYARVEEYPNEDYAGQLIIRIGKDDADLEVGVLDNHDDYLAFMTAFIRVYKAYQALKPLEKYKIKIISNA